MSLSEMRHEVIEARGLLQQPPQNEALEDTANPQIVVLRPSTAFMLVLEETLHGGEALPEGLGRDLQDLIPGEDWRVIDVVRRYVERKEHLYEVMTAFEKALILAEDLVSGEMHAWPIWLSELHFASSRVKVNHAISSVI